jgi:hypothetical protein
VCDVPNFGDNLLAGRALSRSEVRALLGDCADISAVKSSPATPTSGTTLRYERAKQKAHALLTIPYHPK